MPIYEIKNALPSGGSPRGMDDWCVHYEDNIQFEAESDAAAIAIAEAYQDAHDAAYKAANPGIENFNNWDFAPCYTGALYRIDISDDWETYAQI